jgi:hypothetical protein
MILQTVKSTGIAILLGAGVLATMAVAQKGMTPAADSAAQPAGASLLLAPNKRPPGPQPRKQPNPDDLQRKTQGIMQALEEPIAMNFPNETPLDDVLKYIKVATTTPAFSGIPIYVTPRPPRSQQVAQLDNRVRPGGPAPEDVVAIDPQVTRPVLYRQGRLPDDRLAVRHYRDPRGRGGTQVRPSTGGAGAARAGQVTTSAPDVARSRSTSDCRVSSMTAVGDALS